MAVGNIQNEDDLRAFIQQTLRGSNEAKLVRQLQGDLKLALHGERIVRGTVRGSDGATIAGTGFSAVRTGVGLYTITFSPAFASTPAVDALPVAAGAVPWTCALQALPTVSAVGIRNVAGGANADLDFCFVAVG